MPDKIISTESPHSLFNTGKETINDSFQDGIELITQAKELAIQQKDFSLACEILVFISRKMRFKVKYFESMEYLNKAYRLLNQYIPHDKTQLASIYKEYGSLYTDGFNDYTSGLNYTLRSLKLNIEELKASSYTNIGCQYIQLNEFEKAYFFLIQGQQICKKTDNISVLTFIYENLGNLFFKQKEYLQAEKYYLLGLETCEKALHQK